jgi:hypothetical protein
LRIDEAVANEAALQKVKGLESKLQQKRRDLRTAIELELEATDYCLE